MRLLYHLPLLLFLYLPPFCMLLCLSSPLPPLPSLPSLPLPPLPPSSSPPSLFLYLPPSLLPSLPPSLPPFPSLLRVVYTWTSCQVHMTLSTTRCHSNHSTSALSPRPPNTGLSEVSPTPSWTRWRGECEEGGVRGKGECEEGGEGEEGGGCEER